MKVLLSLALFGLLAVTSRASECPSEGENVVLPNPEKCSTYYICKKGIKILTNCPTGLHFDPIKLTCDYPKQAGCEKNTPEEPEKPEVPEVPASIVCPPQQSVEENILIPNPKDCRTFYHCSNGVPHLKKCPNGLHFNPRKEFCDWPSEAKCVEN